MWENWSLAGFLITPVVVGVYVSERGREQNGEREAEDVRREMRICDYTQKLGQGSFLYRVSKIQEGVLETSKRWQHAPLLCLHLH